MKGMESVSHLNMPHYIVQRTVYKTTTTYNVHGTVYGGQCTPYTVRRTSLQHSIYNYDIYCVIYNVRNTLYY